LIKEKKKVKRQAQQFAKEKTGRGRKAGPLKDCRWSAWIKCIEAERQGKKTV
jgi:hypothetical protein